ncbi:MAG: hypothetical protein ACFFA6_10745 [Promethearchaeota archaeon]
MDKIKIITFLLILALKFKIELIIIISKDRSFALKEDFGWKNVAGPDIVSFIF